MSQDQQFMQQAIALAKQAYSNDEVPIGALVVGADNAVLATGYNQVEAQDTQIAHAEAIAIKQAGEILGDWRLDGCTLYVTVEPCLMCMALIRLSRIERVVYGAKSPLFGYRLDNAKPSSVYKNVAIDGGICAPQATQLMKQFFKEKRQKKGEYEQKKPQESQ